MVIVLEFMIAWGLGQVLVRLMRGLVVKVEDLKLFNKKVFLSFIFIFSISFANALFKKRSIDKKDLNGVKIESGGLVQIGQYLKKNFKHNGKDNYKVEFICTPGKRKDRCQAVNVNILPTSASF